MRNAETQMAVDRPTEEQFLVVICSGSGGQMPDAPNACPGIIRFLMRPGLTKEQFLSLVSQAAEQAWAVQIPDPLSIPQPEHRPLHIPVAVVLKG